MHGEEILEVLMLQDLDKDKDMRRQQYYQPQQQYADPGIIETTPLNFYNPEIIDQQIEASKGLQQRWDATQSNIAKHWEELGAANLGNFRPWVEDEMNKRYNAMEEGLKEKYGNGVIDYGREANTIIKNLSKDRALMHQGTQAAAQISQAEKEFQTLKAAGKAPVYYTQGKDGKPVKNEYTFEQWHGKDKLGGVQDGKFIMPQLNALRSAGEGDKWTMENISNPIMKGMIEGNLGNAGYGYLRSIAEGGMSDTQVDELFNSKHGKDYVNSFLTNSDFASEEFKNSDGTINVPLAKEYLKDLVKVQTSEILKKQYMQNPDEMEKIKKRNDKPEEPYVPPATFTGQGIVDEINQKAVKEATEIKTTLGKAEAVRKKINIIKDNNLPVFNEGLPPVWENPVTPDFQEQEKKWKIGEASYADAVDLGAKRMAQAASYVVGLVDRSASWVANTAEAGKRKKDLRINIYSDFGFKHDGKYTTPSQETKDKYKMSKYLELLWDEKDKYNLVKDSNGLIKIDDTKPSGTQVGSSATVGERYKKAAFNVSKILNDGLANMGKDAQEAYNKIQEYREKNPIVDILAGRFEEESDGDTFTMYNKAIDQMINTKKDQELVFSKTTPLSKITASGDDIVKNNIKTRIIQMPGAGLILEYNTDNGSQTIDTKTAEDINTAIVGNKLQSTQLDINNFNILLTTDAGTNYKVDIVPLLPDQAKPVVQSIKDFIKKGTELDFFKRDGQGNVIKENGKPVYEEPVLNMPFGSIKYELSTKGKTAKPILKGSSDNGETWEEISSEILTTYISEYLNTILSQGRY